jgi:hypothetical protein
MESSISCYIEQRSTLSSNSPLKAGRAGSSCPRAGKGRVKSLSYLTDKGSEKQLERKENRDPSL